MAGGKNVEEWTRLFKDADTNKNGSLELEELKKLLENNGSKVPPSVVQHVFISFDGDKGDNKITLEEFIKGLEAIEENIKELTSIFKKHDADNSGWLDQKEFANVIKESGFDMSEQEIKDLLQQIDPNNDNKITLEEFFNAST
uniref:EF-hand domain-containing protein n=1 Tax=Arion vulgaris TaxID=1028688 RepID=A0A0B7ADC6_9EUPU